MAIGLDDALLGWLVASAGDGFVRRLRDPAKTAMRKVVEEAIDATLGQVAGGLDDGRVEHLRSSLLTHDIGVSDQPFQVGNETELRKALHDWAAALDHPEYGQPGYLAGLNLAPRLLADALTGQIIDGIRRSGRCGGPLKPLAEWSWRDAVGADVGEIKEELSQLHRHLTLDEPRRRDRRSDPASVSPPSMEPRLPFDFVDRPILGAKLVGAIAAAADQPGEAEPVVLTGPGGFGKTQLAAWACHQDEVRERFSGVLWVELGQHQNNEDLVRWLSDLTARLTGRLRPTYQTVSVAADAFAEALGDRQVLLVLDDVWQAPDVMPFLNGGSRCVRLLTTRRPVAVAGHEIRVDPMTTSEGAKLLQLRLPEATTEELTPLVERSGRWPLALALLRNTLHSRHHRHGMTVPEAVDSLVAGLDQYSIDELTDGRSIKATLSLSLNELIDSDPDALDRYISLAAFGPGEQVPTRLLERLWRMRKVRVLSEFDRFFDRSLVVSTDADGVRLHDVIRDELRRWFPDRPRETSQTLLDACRPAEGWHALTSGHNLWPQLAQHFIQAGRQEELGRLLRDLRFLAARLDQGGPVALESDLETYSNNDGYATKLRAILRQEAHLFVGHATQDDLALTLHSRLLGRSDIFAEVTHVNDALPQHGLVADHPLPEQADSRIARVLTGHHGWVTSVTWSQRGDALASAGHNDNTLRLWHAPTGEQLNVIPVPDEVHRARLSPDGRFLAVVVGASRSSKRSIHVLDASTGEVIPKSWDTTKTGIDGPNFAWNYDSTSVAIADGKKVSLWTPCDEGNNRSLRVQSTVTDVSWHPTAGVACVTDDATIIWWPEQDGKRQEHWDLSGLLGRSGYALEWQPEGNHLAIASQRRVVVVDPNKRRIVGKSKAGNGWPNNISWHPDGRALAVAWTSGKVTLWQDSPPQSEDTEMLLDELDSNVRDVAWSPDGESIAIPGNPEIWLWRPQPKPKIDAKLRDLARVEWQPNGRLLGLTWTDGALGAVNADRPQSVLWRTERSSSYNWKNKIAWSPDGRYLVDKSPGDPRAAWDAQTGMIEEKPGYSADCSGCRYNLCWRDSTQLRASRSDRGGGAVVFAAIKDGQKHIRFDTGRHPLSDHVEDIDISSEGDRLALCFFRGGLEVVDTYLGTRTVLDKGGHWTDLSFIPGTDRLLALGLDRTLTLWDARKAEVVNQLPQARIKRFAVDPTGSHLAACMSDRIALFDAHSLEQICCISVDEELWDCAFDPTEELLSAVGRAGVYIFRVRWPVQPSTGLVPEPGSGSG